MDENTDLAALNCAQLHAGYLIRSVAAPQTYLLSRSKCRVRNTEWLPSVAPLRRSFGRTSKFVFVSILDYRPVGLAEIEVGTWDTGIEDSHLFELDEAVTLRSLMCCADPDGAALFEAAVAHAVGSSQYDPLILEYAF